MSENPTTDKKQGGKRKYPKYRRIWWWILEIAYAPVLWLLHRPRYHYTNGAPRRRKFRAPAICVPNHISFNDGSLMQLVWARRRVFTLTGKLTFDLHPVLGWILLATGNVCIDTETTDLEGIRTALSRIKDEKGILTVFPTGHIYPEHSPIESLKAGAAFIAQRAGVPIIPMHFGTTRVFRRAQIWIGKPVDTDGIREEAAESGVRPTDVLIERVRLAMEGLRVLEIERVKHSRLEKTKKRLKNGKIPKEVWSLRAPVRGCQIRVSRGDYYHHGIYLSDAEVIHFAAPGRDFTADPADCTVHAATLADFLRGGIPEVRTYGRREKNRVFPPEITVHNAVIRQGTGGYSLKENNCEHFSNLCAFGIAYSTQTEKA
ncbi:MAG: lecithin retinol acyltransferase family protein [Clostridiales bacterium]|jgi:1-acyl-sn-glycerol-3-phosphate acyltransferase|nr:lecithin retinol acyltransferase family protein [Clostridiales bacterium]